MKSPIHLPCYQMTVTLTGDGHTGTVSSELHDGTDPACNAIESFVLAMACAGIDIATPAMLEAIETVVDAVGNHDDPSYDVVVWCSDGQNNDIAMAVHRTEEECLKEGATWVMRDMTKDKWSDENRKHINAMAKDEDWEGIIDYYNDALQADGKILIQGCVKVNDGEPDPEEARQKMIEEVDDEDNY